MTGGAPRVPAQLREAGEGLWRPSEVQELQEWSAAALQASSNFIFYFLFKRAAHRPSCALWTMHAGKQHTVCVLHTAPHLPCGPCRLLSAASTWGKVRLA